jgi:hypothetical protein
MILSKIVTTKIKKYKVEIDTVCDVCSIYNVDNEIPFYVVHGFEKEKSYKQIIKDTINKIEHKEQVKLTKMDKEFINWDGIIN